MAKTQLLPTAMQARAIRENLLRPLSTKVNMPPGVKANPTLRRRYEAQMRMAGGTDGFQTFRDPTVTQRTVDPRHPPFGDQLAIYFLERGHETPEKELERVHDAFRHFEESPPSSTSDGARIIHDVRIPALLRGFAAYQWARNAATVEVAPLLQALANPSRPLPNEVGLGLLEGLAHLALEPKRQKAFLGAPQGTAFVKLANQLRWRTGSKKTEKITDEPIAVMAEIATQFAQRRVRRNLIFPDFAGVFVRQVRDQHHVQRLKEVG